MKLLHYIYIERAIKEKQSENMEWKEFFEKFVEDRDHVFKERIEKPFILEDFEPCFLADNIHLQMNSVDKYLAENKNESFKSWYTELHQLARMIKEGSIFFYCLQGKKKIRIVSSSKRLCMKPAITTLIDILSECVKDSRRGAPEELDYMLTLFLNGALVSVYDYEICKPYHINKRAEIFIQSPNIET